MRASTLIGCVAVSVLAVATVSCGGDGGATPETTGTTTVPSTTVTTTVPSTSGVGAELDVTSDVRFASAAPGIARWTEPLLDVYAPAGAHDLPLVVLFTPHNLTKDNATSVQLARAVAASDAVVVVTNWSQLEDRPETFTDPAALTEIVRAGQSFARCAVSFAVAHAREYGADPSRLALAGELFGANTASIVALGTPDPLEGCAAPVTDWTATGVVGVNGDWLVGYPAFDAVAPAAVAALSPWALLDRAPKIRARLVVTDAAPAMTEVCGERDSALMVARDPTGAMRQRLDAVGAYADGCVDLGDEAAAMAAEMTSFGLTAEVVALPNADGATQTVSGAEVLEYGPADLALLTDTIMAVVGA